MIIYCDLFLSTKTRRFLKNIYLILSEFYDDLVGNVFILFLCRRIRFVRIEQAGGLRIAGKAE